MSGATTTFPLEPEHSSPSTFPPQSKYHVDPTSAGVSRKYSGATFQDLTSTYPVPYLIHPAQGPPKSPGNPTALALFVFAITLGTVGVYYAKPAGLTIYNTVVGLTLFGGGMTLWVSAFLELWLGNTYAAVVLGGFSVFYLTFSASQIPWFGIIAAYEATTAAGVPDGARQKEISNGIWIAAYAIFDMIIFLPTFRISRVFVLIIGLLIPCFWALAIGEFITDPVTSERWEKTGGWFAIFSAAVGFYAGAATIWTKDTVGFDLPVGEYVRPKKTEDEEKRSE